MSRLALALALLTFSSGCISAPPPKKTLAEQASHENAIGADLANRFESQLSFRRDPVVDNYLNRLAKTLGVPSGDPRISNIRVATIGDTKGLWRSFGLPGKRVYLPANLLKKLKYDNEVAALIAIEDGNIQTTQAIDNLNRQLSATPKPQTIDFLGPDGIFSFSSDHLKDSIRAALKLLYDAGFDGRGMIELWRSYSENPERSPYSRKTLQEFLDFTRQTISLYAPLRDPIVGTSEFQSIRRRMEKL